MDYYIRDCTSHAAGHVHTTFQVKLCEDTHPRCSLWWQGCIKIFIDIFINRIAFSLMYWGRVYHVLRNFAACHSPSQIICEESFRVRTLRITLSNVIVMTLNYIHASSGLSPLFPLFFCFFKRLRPDERNFSHRTQPHLFFSTAATSASARLISTGGQTRNSSYYWLTVKRTKKRMNLSRKSGPWVLPVTQIIFYELCGTTNAVTRIIKWLFFSLSVHQCLWESTGHASGGGPPSFFW